MGANDSTVAWRMIVSGEALLRLEEALVPFGEGPWLMWSGHDSQDRVFCMVSPASETREMTRYARYLCVAAMMVCAQPVLRCPSNGDT
jgi:hypothetical protein